MRTMNFTFEELPLVIEGGFEAALVNGSAEISYRGDGDWGIERIYSDGYRKRSPQELRGDLDVGTLPRLHEEKPVELDPGTPLYLIIYHRLEHEWLSKVQRAVNEQIKEDRESEADDYADYRRDERKSMEIV